MVGLGVGELILMAMLAGGLAPNAIAFGNPMVWLAQSVVTRSAPIGVLAGAWLVVGSPGRGPVGVMPAPPPPPATP